MTITVTPAKLHWNYFLALERDLEVVARYVELCEANFQTFSLELAHLLFTAASEVDVIAKLLCRHIDPNAPRSNINEYRVLLMSANPALPNEEVFVPRYGLRFCPWENWNDEKTPDWWRSYNNVKHERDAHFNEATLKNALNAMGALLVCAHWYYVLLLSQAEARTLDKKEGMAQLLPTSNFLRLHESYYYESIVV